MKAIILKFLVLTASAFVLGAPQPPPSDAADLHGALAKRDGKLNCGNFASGNKNTAKELVNNLNNYNKAHIAPRSCHRMQCKDTTAVYVCNDNRHALDMRSKDVYNRAVNILEHCCGSDLPYWKNGLAYPAVGGQQWTDALGGNWNVVVGYGNCRHPTSQPPNEVGGWGVNGPGCTRGSLCSGRC